MSFLRRLLGRNAKADEKTTSKRIQPETDPAVKPYQSSATAPSKHVESPKTATEPLPGKDTQDLQRPDEHTTRELGDQSDTLSSLAAYAVPAAKRFRVGYASDVGQLRDHNEDSLIAFQGTHLGHGASDPFGFFVVADGMGGHNAGEVASSLAARLVTREVLRQVYIPYLLNETPDADPVPLTEILKGAVQKANNHVHQQVPGSGTTLTCALILGGRAYIAHVGDSRVYLAQNHEIKQVTRDHSYVGRLMELGELSPEQAAVHPQRHVLYRAIGQGENLEVDTYHQPLSSGSCLLLCSDGLSGSVADEEIARIISLATTPQEACQQLIKAANSAGGPDNITAILIQTPHN